MSRKKGKKYDLDFRYGSGWQNISRKAREVCKSCCWCVEKKATLVHHVRYVDSVGDLLLDNVKIGDDIYPVCAECHMIIHSDKYWIYSNVGKEHNHNTNVAKERLDFGYYMNLHNQN